MVQYYYQQEKNKSNTFLSGDKGDETTGGNFHNSFSQHSTHKLSFLKVRPPARGANPFPWYLRTVSHNPLNKAIKFQIKNS